jgi:2-dehydro-3-deoxy-D-gluconate 5-dehydrogenase
MILDLFSLKDKKAIVTGGTTGLGYAIAEALVEAGARVAIVGHSARLEKAAAELQAVPLKADLSQPAEVETIVPRALQQLGGLDILVNNAGTQIRHPSEEFPLEDWRKVMAVNLDAVFILCQAAGRHMLAHGGGKIINIASVQSLVAGWNIPAYTASKGGVAQLTKALANEWAGRGINVNAIAPGYIQTEMTAALVNNPEREPAILARMPAGRWGKPADLQGAVVFLASKASDFIHGAIIPVDGGYLAR